MDFATIRRVWLPLIIASAATGYIFKTAPGPHDWMRWLGLVLALIGIAGVILSRYTLGRSFSIVPKATALVTTGIYSKIRNPICVSGTFFIAGAVLMLRRPEGLLLLMIVIPLQIFRARREAAVLEAKFGDEYREYRRRTWF
jgi:protein-S-isoprenylcysteine O-methyltransferase Ste14